VIQASHKIEIREERSVTEERIQELILLIKFESSYHLFHLPNRGLIRYHMEYAPIMEYCCIGGLNCDNTIHPKPPCRLGAWVKWSWSPVVLARISYLFVG